jgi:carbon-monoxide dehydrogenase medium subunit
LHLYAQSPDAVPFAGGTDYMVEWNAGRRNGDVVLDLSRLREWARLRATKTSLVLGALATHTEIQAHAGARRRFPLLVDACGMVGGAQIQNRGTIGGNIANASPAGDTFPPLLVYEARVRTASVSGRRTIPMAEFFRGVKKTALGRGELIESVEIPLLARRPTRQVFRKVGTRAAQAISKTVAAGLLFLDRKGTVQELRFALGSMAPTARRLRTVEVFLHGQRLTPAVVDEACRLVAADVAPIDDIRSTADYRLLVSKNLLRAFLEG